MHYQGFDSRNTLPTNSGMVSEGLQHIARFSLLVSRISLLVSRLSLLNQLTLPDVSVVAEI
jgi:hypothetical protein